MRPPVMVFSDIYKGPRSPLARLRSNQTQNTTQPPDATPDWLGDEYADLTSKDKSKQKEAVKRYLNDKVKTDWTFPWPPPNSEAPSEHDQPRASTDLSQGNHKLSPEIDLVQDETNDDPGYQADGPDADEKSSEDSDDDVQSIYSVVSEDGLHYRPRVEWVSDLSDDDMPMPSPFRFDSPDAVGPSVHRTTLEKQTRRRRAVREETIWNDGVACFEARRNAWTGARTVRVRPKPVSPPAASPRSPRRFFFRRSLSESPPSQTPLSLAQAAEGSGMTSDGSSVNKDNDKDLNKRGTKDSSVSTAMDPSVYPVETLLPIGQPLLPPNNPLRASITPPIYLNLYDKVILHNLQPSCPINLGDMVRSCVSGWKRDGEWPPRQSAPDPTMAMRKRKKKAAAAAAIDGGTNNTRRMSFGILGREKDEESKTGKGIRRSLQRALGLGSTPGTPESPAEKPKAG